MAKKVNGKKCVEILLAAAAAGFKDYYFFFRRGETDFTLLKVHKHCLVSRSNRWWSVVVVVVVRTPGAYEIATYTCTLSSTGTTTAGKVRGRESPRLRWCVRTGGIMAAVCVVVPGVAIVRGREEYLRGCHAANGKRQTKGCRKRVSPLETFTLLFITHGFVRLIMPMTVHVSTHTHARARKYI